MQTTLSIYHVTSWGQGEMHGLTLLEADTILGALMSLTGAIRTCAPGQKLWPSEGPSAGSRRALHSSAAMHPLAARALPGAAGQRLRVAVVPCHQDCHPAQSHIALHTHSFSALQAEFVTGLAAEQA